MKQAGLSVELLETRHVRNAFKTMAVKTDRKDARGIADLVRVGWYRPVHCKSMDAQETRAILGARRLVESKLRDVEMSLRGILRGFGLKVGKTTQNRFAARIKQLVSGHATLQVIAEALLAVHEVLLREFKSFEKRVRTMAREDAKARLLMTTTGVGAIVSLTYAAGVGDESVRTALFQAAHIMLTKPVKGSALKSWALRLAKRVGMKKAKVALARKLAVVMHRMLVDGKPFNPALGAAA
jgi:transposase